jgi:photosystem II stability/assembly factor-like uncharacterized protein
MDVKKRYLALISVVLAVFLLFSGCTTEEKDADQGQTNDSEETNGGATDQNETEFEDCGNEIGNGAEIISGPSEPENEADRDNPFRSLTVHPTNSDIILVGTERNGILKSEDGGTNWSRLRYGIRHSYAGYPEIYDLSYVTSNPEIIYVASVEGTGPVTGDYPSSNAGVYKSTDSGETWSRINCGLDNGCVSSIYALTEDNIVIGVRGGPTTFTGFDVSGQYFDGGIFRTTNGGTQWNRVNIVENDNICDYMVIRSTKDNPQLMYTYGFNFDDQSKNAGFLKSNDGGETWAQFAPSLKDNHISYFDISSDGNTIYAADERKIQKSIDAGETWTEHNLQSDGYAIAVFPDDPNRVLYGIIGAVFLSTDGLSSSNQVITIQNPQQHVADIVISPSDTSICYVITVGYDLYKSTNAGASFTKIANLRDDVLNVIL